MTEEMAMLERAISFKLGWVVLFQFVLFVVLLIRLDRKGDK